MGNTLDEQKRRDRKTASDWRRRADSNRWCSFCRAVPYHLATSPGTEGSGRRGSNPRLSPWQGDALPLSHSRVTVAILLSHYRSCVCKSKVPYREQIVNRFLD